MHLFPFFFRRLTHSRRWLNACLLAWLMAPLLALAANAPLVQTAEFHFADSGVSSYFYLQKPPAVEDESGQENWLFVVGGSGCQSMKTYLPQYFTGLEGESGANRIWILQKRFVGQSSNQTRTQTNNQASNQASNQAGQTAPCSDAFIRHDHFSQWFADQQAFIRAMLAAQPPAAQRRNRRVIIMGISEGAEVAPALALAIQETTHLVLLAHSGASAMETYRLLAGRYPHMRDGWRTLQDSLRTGPADPDAARVLERSWRYWDEISALDHLRNLNALKLPVLWAYGDADTLIPPDARERLKSRLQPEALKNWRVCVFKDADHGLMSGAGNRMPDFMWQFDRWLAGAPGDDVCSALQ